VKGGVRLGTGGNIKRTGDDKETRKVPMVAGKTKDGDSNIGRNR
jgi:hypothetical protein